MKQKRPEASFRKITSMIHVSLLPSIRVFNKFGQLNDKPYWGNQFWARGYCVDTVGLDTEMIRKYVKHQERKEKVTEQGELFSK